MVMMYCVELPAPLGEVVWAQDASDTTNSATAAGNCLSAKLRIKKASLPRFTISSDW
jgi:hypothetical protein